ncbi:DUF262 domain-containing protein [Micromonospora aurantiaca (nom. illeg.)]|uniref:DUF262 domain-containing protein n=1 Tax=Micromonospora aurantiaca (nom. illeg.) TaxID=47850 RepID=UPI003F4A17E9
MSESTAEGALSVVEVKPEVVFLYELLKELTEGKLRIPRFQRPFVWRRDQMTDLLDSIYKQYPIGSLLVWETDEPIATLERLGPFRFPATSGGAVGYLLDGHQRLSTLAGALISRESSTLAEAGQDPLRWDLSWNMPQGRFQHGRADEDPATLFPLTSLLDTLKFFDAVNRVQLSVGSPSEFDRYIADVSQVARSFQHYRVPVIRIRQTGLSEAVEIFARLNSKGQAMSADQMVSALMYRQSGSNAGFDLASKIDSLSSQLGEVGFGEVDRTTILRSVLANLDEDIYRTDWTRLAGSKRNELLPGLRQGVERASRSLDKAVEFLKGLGVGTSRLLPYTMQLAVLSAFFDKCSSPGGEQLAFLRRWFWVSSFSGWFGGANPSRVNALVSEFRRVVAVAAPERLDNFDMDAVSLPFPATFDMRSARTRTLLLVMLSLHPRSLDGSEIVEPWRMISEKGPDAVGYVWGDLPKSLTGNPANRMIRPPDVPRGLLKPWVKLQLSKASPNVLESHGFDSVALERVLADDVQGFVLARQQCLVEHERRFQERVGVRSSSLTVAEAPVDTE